ncbi:MAG TPA: hypothetical protein VH083_28115 [Myxococcales bacterium]|nr:hypothetical protein [Myxococcales bacterium]
MTTIPPAVAASIRTAAAIPGATVELSNYRAAPASCIAREASVERPYFASGEVMARFTGQDSRGPCKGAALVHATVKAPVWVATRAARPGELIEAAQAEREVHGEPLAQVPPGARAAKAIAAGSIIDADSLQAAAGPTGSQIQVELRDGSLRIATAGRVVPCGRGKSCAVLPSGKHVEGEVENGVLVVSP